MAELSYSVPSNARVIEYAWCMDSSNRLPDDGCGDKLEADTNPTNDVTVPVHITVNRPKVISVELATLELPRTSQRLIEPAWDRLYVHVGENPSASILRVYDAENPLTVLVAQLPAEYVPAEVLASCDAVVFYTRIAPTAVPVSVVTLAGDEFVLPGGGWTFVAGTDLPAPAPCAGAASCDWEGVLGAIEFTDGGAFLSSISGIVGSVRFVPPADLLDAQGLRIALVAELNHDAVAQGVAFPGQITFRLNGVYLETTQGGGGGGGGATPTRWLVDSVFEGDTRSAAPLPFKLQSTRQPPYVRLTPGNYTPAALADEINLQFSIMVVPTGTAIDVVDAFGVVTTVSIPALTYSSPDLFAGALTLAISAAIPGFVATWVQSTNCPTSPGEGHFWLRAAGAFGLNLGPASASTNAIWTRLGLQPVTYSGTAEYTGGTVKVLARYSAASGLLEYLTDLNVVFTSDTQRQQYYVQVPTGIYRDTALDFATDRGSKALPAGLLGFLPGTTFAEPGGGFAPFTFSSVVGTTPPFVLVELVDPKQVTHVVHSAHGDVNASILAKVPTAFLPRLDRFYPMKVSFPTSVRLNTVRLRLLNPDHSLYQLNGQEWSATLRLSTVA